MSAQPSNAAIKQVRLDTILTSEGIPSPQVTFILRDSSVLRASSPAAKKAGRREKNSSGDVMSLQSRPEIAQLHQQLIAGNFTDQLTVDTHLRQLRESHTCGADVSLAYSLAFARTAAHHRKQSLAAYITSLMPGVFSPSTPHPMVNIFSGGIHGGGLSVQQVMLLPAMPTFDQDVKVATAIFDAAEEFAKQQGIFRGYSASKGIMTSGVGLDFLLETLSQIVASFHHTTNVSFGLDIAAEHLKEADGEKYIFEGEPTSGSELAARYHTLLKSYPVTYIEDPFDATDSALWESLRRTVGESIYLVGDDLFATNSQYINKQHANSILLKMNQIGTLTETLAAAQQAQSMDMRLLVSHRSSETDDTAMCDLAVAVGAKLIKIGGPRAERLVKYERLHELALHFG